jgi:hypothetical protein
VYLRFSFSFSDVRRNEDTKENKPRATPVHSSSIQSLSGKPRNPLLVNNPYASSRGDGSCKLSPLSASTSRENGPESFLSASAALNAKCCELGCEWRGSTAGEYYSHLSQNHRLKFPEARQKVRVALKRSEATSHQLDSSRKAAAAAAAAASTMQGRQREENEKRSFQDSLVMSRALSQEKMIDCIHCAKKITGSNMSRHLRTQHQKQQPSNLASASESEEEMQEEVVVRNCGYDGCTFQTTAKAEMAKHRRNNGHPKSVAAAATAAAALQAAAERVGGGESSEEDAEAEMELSLISTETSSSSLPLKYICECGYKSRFRPNLVRHCKKSEHYSEYLANTTKPPLPYFLIKKREGSEKEESRSETKTEDNSSKSFCNFDISGLLDDSDKEEDHNEEGSGDDFQAGLLRYKVL